MPEVTRKRTGELVRGVFKILLPHDDGLPSKDVFQQLEELVPPTRFENETYPNKPDTRRYEKIVRFSTITTVKAGWLIKDRGQWSLTDDGRSAYERITDPEEFAREASKLYRKWKRGQVDQDDTDDGDSPGASATLEESIEAAWTEIHEHLTAVKKSLESDDPRPKAGALSPIHGFATAISEPC